MKQSNGLKNKPIGAIDVAVPVGDFIGEDDGGAGAFDIVCIGATGATAEVNEESKKFQIRISDLPH